ncbi:hypothetical protein [Maribacter algarum]|nr:hypothetical protein [Maribacter algarum]
MKAKNLVFALAVLFVTGMFTSCSDNAEADDNLYDSIEKKEVKNEDT